jgi:hypothetical protein
MHEVSISPQKQEDKTWASAIPIRSASPDFPRETTLRRQESYIRSIVVDQSELVIRCKPYGAVTFLNMAAKNLYKIDATEIVSKKISNL